MASETTETTATPAERLRDEVKQVGVEKFTAENYKTGLVRHIVLFRYSPSVTPAQKQEIKRGFLALDSSLRNGKRYIVSIETGSANSGEGADNGFEQGFVVTFRSQGDRNYYVGQPVIDDPAHYDLAHQAFKEFVGPQLDSNGVLVFDFAL